MMDVLNSIKRHRRGAKLTRVIMRDFLAKGGKFNDQAIAQAYYPGKLVSALRDFASRAVDAGD